MRGILPHGLLLGTLLTGCVGDHAPPVLRLFTPVDGTDARGARLVPARLLYTDDSDATVTFYADGERLGTRTTPACPDRPCVVELSWNTADTPIGEHELQAVIEDDAGNITDETHVVSIDDVLTVTQIELASGVVDDVDPLEIEVFAIYEGTNGLAGCAGSRHGMNVVDAAATLYEPDAMFVDRVQSGLLATRDVGTRPFRLEVWEDDDDPVCPTLPDPALNDHLGASPARTADEWRGISAPEAFGDVARLGVAWTRKLTAPISYEEGAPPPIDTTEGCSTGAGSTGIAFAGILFLRRRRTRDGIMAA